jgi:hypothetical protein
MNRGSCSSAFTPQAVAKAIDELYAGGGHKHGH